jgi:MFS transporter, putative metabolite:H+ symporter
MFVGAGLFGRLPDMFGRKTVFTYTIIGYSLCTFIMAFQTEAIWINFWRFFASIGIGLEQVVIVTYISELVSSRYRGRAIAIEQTLCLLAMPVVALVSWWLTPTSFMGLEGWRVVVLIGAFSAMLVWFIRRAIPESPIWLESKGRTEAARNIVDDVESRMYPSGDVPSPQDTGVDNTVRPGHDQPAKARWAALMAPSVRWLVVMMVVVNIFNTVGYYGFASWVPTLLVSKGITTVKSLQYGTIMAIAAPLAPALTLLFADKIERKFQFVTACALCSLLGVAFSMQNAPMLVIALGFLLTLNNGWLSSSYHTYQTELFPSSIRGTAVGFCYAWSRLSAVFVSYLVAYFLAHYGTTGVFTFITASMALVIFVVLVFGPRTNKFLAR